MLKHSHVAILLVLLIGCSTVFTGCKPESLVSTSQEVGIGRQASQQIESNYPVNKDPELNRLVNEIGQNLVQYSERQDIKYTFKVLDLKDVNAVSLPGGWIYVYKGLIDNTKGDVNELAGVIAHEIGHIAARHHAEMIGRETFAGILVVTLTRGDVRQWANLFANLTLLRWSRKHEYESDRLGVKYMYQSRYSAEGLVNFLERLQQIQKDKPSEFEQIFRTHPVTEERVKRAKNFLADLKAGTRDP